MGYVSAMGYKLERRTRAEADAFCAELSEIIGDIPHEVLGSMRRGRATIGDLDIMVVTDDGQDPVVLLEILYRLQRHYDCRVRICGGKWLSVAVGGLFLCEFKHASELDQGACRLMMTGSGDFNVGMRGFAKRMGYKLSQYGLFIRDTETIVASRTERDIFAALGVEYVTPRERDAFRPVADPFGGYELPEVFKTWELEFA